MSIEAVVFDVGNVLIEWQPEDFYDREFGEKRRREIFETVDLHGMNDGIDRGGNWRSTVYEWADRYPDHREAVRMWHDRWIELASPIIPHSVQLLRNLRKKGLPVFALTNFGAETFEYASSMYRFLEEFDRSYVSGRLGLIKPDPGIYAHVEQESGMAPEALLFVDDRRENCEAAAVRGWNVHQFHHPQGWADRLVSEGLLSQKEAAFWGSA